MAAHEDGEDVPVRMERDALGELRVAEDALWGAHTERAGAVLGVSDRGLFHAPALYCALGEVKQAAAIANLEAGVLTPEIAGAIGAAARELAQGVFEPDLIADLVAGGGSIALHMNVAEVIANAANERLGSLRGAYAPVEVKRHVNASQSTADVCHTAARIAVLRETTALGAVLARLVSSLEHKAGELADVITLARTCLRDALPASLGLVFAGHAAVFARRAAALADAAAPLLEVVLGGTVIGTGDGAPPAYRERVVPILAEITELPLAAHPRPSDALATSDDLTAVSAQLAGLAQAAVKLARDVRLLSSGPAGGFGELVLPHVLEGSSFFADKSNPVVAETLLQAGLQCLGYDRVVQAAGEHADPWLQVFDGLAAVNVLDACALLGAALDRFEAHCLCGLTADTDRCRSLAALGRSA